MLHILDSMNYLKHGSICSSTKQTVSSQQLNFSLRLFEQKRKPNRWYFTVRSWQSHDQTKARDYPLLAVRQNHSSHHEVMCSIRNLFKQGRSSRMVSGLYLGYVRLDSALAKEISSLKLFVLFHKSLREMQGRFLKIHSVKPSIYEFWRQIISALDRTSLYNIWPIRYQSRHRVLVRRHPCPSHAGIRAWR